MSPLERLVDKLTKFEPELLFCTKEEVSDKLQAFIGRQPEVLDADFSISIDVNHHAKIYLNLRLKENPKRVHTINISVSGV